MDRATRAGARHPLARAGRLALAVAELQRVRQVRPKVKTCRAFLVDEALESRTPTEKSLFGLAQLPD